MNQQRPAPTPSARAGARRRHAPARRLCRQRGAAVLMALFIATLATLLVTGLFYRQFVLLRTIENQQLLAQSRQLLRGALDWGRAILREDQRTTPFDALNEPWAQPLAETRLEDLGETSPFAAQAALSGSIEDAQGRFNLKNLVDSSVIVPRELDTLRRLATLLQLPEQTADLIAQRVLLAQPPPATNPDGTPIDPSTLPKSRPIPLLRAEDIGAIAGIDPNAAARLAPYVVVLDEITPVNANTTTPEVLSARVPDLSLADARSIIGDRDRLGYFTDLADVRKRLGSRAVTDRDLATTSRYFFVRGQVKLDRAVTRMEALVKRGFDFRSSVVVLWEREL